MTQEKSFKITEFTNPSGEIVFRVSGWLDGNRVRKNFPTRAEAVAKRQTLEVQKQTAKGPEIRHVPISVRKLFLKRHEQINEETKSRSRKTAHQRT